MKTRFLTAAPLMLWASISAADPLPTWKAAMLSGSERLSFFSVLKSKPKGFKAFAKSFMFRDGLYHQPGAGLQKVYSSAGARPLVDYDTNLNSGIPVDEFTLGEFTFRTNEEDRAKAGFTVGGMLYGARHYSVAPGHVLKYAGLASYEYAPEHDLSKFYIYGSSCLSSHVASYTWIDSCTGFRVAEKKNARVEELYLTLGGSQAFASQLGHHEAQWTFKRAFQSDYAKNTLSVGLHSAIPQVGAVYGGLTLGEKVSGKHTALHGLSLSFTRPVLGRRTTFAASYLKSGGGAHFGLPREDEDYTVKVSSQVHENLTVSLGYAWTASDIAMYDSESVIFDVNFKAWTF